MAKVDHVVDHFAARLASLKITQINEIKIARWIEDFEKKLPKALPGSYRSLVTRYSFQSFDLRGISFFGNTGTSNDNSDDLVVASLADRHITDTLLYSGYVQIGRPDTGDYDPICFDTNKPKQNREYSIVRIDHEEVLCNHRIKVRVEVATSFLALIEEYLE
jgi:hypothetical protein